MGLFEWAPDATTAQTPQTVANQQAIANALLQANQSTPQNIGEGLASIGRALAYRMAASRVDSEQAAGTASGNAAFAPILSALGGDSAGNPDSSQGASSSSTIPANAADLAKTFMDMGYTPPQAAGVVGNLVQESSLNPGAVGDGGISKGLAQWNGPRLAALQNFAASQGKSWQDPDVQTAFIGQELGTTESTAGNALRAAQTPAQAAAAFEGFERPQGWTPGNPAGGSGFGNRVGAADRIAAALQGVGGPQTPPVATPAVQVASLDPTAGMVPPDPAASLPTPAQAATAAIQPAPTQSAPVGDPNAPAALPGGSSVAPPAPQQVAQAQPAPIQPPQQGGPSLQQLIAAESNPWLTPGQKAVADALLQQKLKQQDPVNYGFTTQPDGTILRENPRLGTVEPVYQGAVKPQTQVVNGRLLQINPDGTAKDITPSGMPSGFRAATPAEIQQYGLPAGTPAQVGPNGEMKVLGGGLGGGASADDIKSVGDAIINGTSPPVMTGMYRNSLPLKAYLANQGFDLSKAGEDWTATNKLLGTMNGAQQTRLRQAVGQVKEALPLVNDLADQWNGGGFPILNKVNLALATQGALGPQAQSIATQLQAEIADVTSELGTVYKGGNSSTDESLRLASTQLQADWSYPTLKAAIALADKNITYRENSLRLGTAGIPDSTYNQVQATPDITGGAAPRIAPAAVASPTQTVQPPAPAIQMLKGNPALAPQFDQKYGAGAAAQVLGQ